MDKFAGRCSCQTRQDVNRYCCESEVKPAYTKVKNETRPYISNKVYCNKEINRCSTCGQVRDRGKKCSCSEKRDRCNRCHSNKCHCRRRRSWW